jgi:hypothetical protein
MSPLHALAASHSPINGAKRITSGDGIGPYRSR